MKNHTPGPWSYTGHDDHCDVGRDYHEIVDADGFEIINNNGLVTSISDARLIAAAPAMADLLRKLQVDISAMLTTAQSEGSDACWMGPFAEGFEGDWVDGARGTFVTWPNLEILLGEIDAMLAKTEEDL